MAPATSSGKQTKKRPPSAARLAHEGPRWFIYPTCLCSHLIRSLGDFILAVRHTQAIALSAQRRAIKSHSHLARKRPSGSPGPTTNPSPPVPRPHIPRAPPGLGTPLLPPVLNHPLSAAAALILGYLSPPAGPGPAHPPGAEAPCLCRSQEPKKNHSWQPQQLGQPLGRVF